MCKQCFNQAGSLKKHERIHSGEKPFKCKTCNASFRHSLTLNNHERTHTRERPFKAKIVITHIVVWISWKDIKGFTIDTLKTESFVHLMLDSCRLLFGRSHFERSENEFSRSRFSDLLELNSSAKLQNWLLSSIEPSFLLCKDLKTRFYRTQKPGLTWIGSVQI